MFQLQHLWTYGKILLKAKKKKMRKYYKYDKVGHLAKDYIIGQNIKNRSV